MALWSDSNGKGMGGYFSAFSRIWRVTGWESGIRVGPRRSDGYRWPGSRTLLIGFGVRSQSLGLRGLADGCCASFTLCPPLFFLAVSSGVAATASKRLRSGGLLRHCVDGVAVRTCTALFEIIWRSPIPHMLWKAT